MRFDPFMNERNKMALGYIHNTGFTTATGTATNITTTSNTDSWIMEHQQEQRIYEQQQRVRKKRMQEKESIRFKPNSLVRNLPFVHGGDSLLATLQRDFDHWAKPQMRLLNG